ncbi:MAG: hypothetical protein HYZ71_12895 [Deltaproteobacteria bacterium]|nr:hypothetical protein [Deltaproteobacteria bacterium]
MKLFILTLLVALPVFAGDAFSQADKAQAKGEAVKPFIVRENPRTGDEVVLGAGQIDEADLKMIISTSEEDTNRDELGAKVAKVVDTDENQVKGFRAVKGSELPEHAHRGHFYGGYHGGYGWRAPVWGGCRPYYNFYPQHYAGYYPGYAGGYQPGHVNGTYYGGACGGCYQGCYSGCYQPTYYYSPVARWSCCGFNYYIYW